jgi:hypothetical protein
MNTINKTQRRWSEENLNFLLILTVLDLLTKIATTLKEVSKMKKILMVLAILLFFTGQALADPISPFNTRPVTVNPSGDPAPGPPFAGPNLQDILNYMFGNGVVSATADQQSAGMWGTSVNPPSIAPNLVVEIAGNANINYFGIWSGTDTTAVTTLDIFNGAAVGVNAGGPSVASLVWDLAGKLDVSGGVGVIAANDFVGINPYSFGFYLKNSVDGWLFFTIDQLNANNEAHALAFRKPGGGDTWAIAFEDLPFLHVTGSPWSDKDYNDMVVKIESIAPAVPEPATMLLLGSGLIGLAGFARKRFKK